MSETSGDCNPHLNFNLHESSVLPCARHLFKILTMADYKIERRRVLSRKFKSEDVKQGIENGVPKSVARRTTIAGANLNLARSKSQLGLSHLYASFTEIDYTYKVNT